MRLSARCSADLSAYPRLVVIYLGLRVYSLRGLLTASSLRKQERKAVEAKPEGLLWHESFYFSLLPLHIGLRQYWRDFDGLERWTRSLPHQDWWRKYRDDPRGTGFWHETYCCDGGIEGVYDFMREPTGLLQFLPAVAPVSRRFNARGRLDVNRALADKVEPAHREKTGFGSSSHT